VPPKRDERGGLPPLPKPERLHFARACSAALAVAGRSDDGLVGALTALSGRAWNLLGFDCRFNSVEETPFAGTAVILCDSGVRSPVAAVADAEVRVHCAAAARKLGVKSLRSVETALLRGSKARLDDREYECSLHVTGEIQRVSAAERALREEDHRQFGSYLTMSHGSFRDNLRSSCAELDLLVELAGAFAGCLGTRAIGPGFGGATVSLVPYHDAEPFMAHMATTYAAKTGRELKPIVLQIVDGAGV
jgi:galactokinase